MRVLLSAYACEPDRGSEPEVGWQWALHMLAHADEVWVLTRLNNKEVIEANTLSYSPGLHFIYYDLPKLVLKLKKKAWFLPVYVMLWQCGAYRLALKHHNDKPFDVVYHVTFVSMMYGSFMGRLGIPFVIAPIAGGDRAPFRLRRSIPLRGYATELLRDLRILFQRYNPLARLAFASAERIYVATPSSLRLIPPKWRSKVAVHLAIATQGHATYKGVCRPLKEPRFVFAGNLLYFKGVHLAIRALAEARNTIRGATLTLFGVGPDEAWLRAVAMRYGVTHAVEFAGFLPRQQLVDSLHQYTAFVFLSFRDSGGMVVLEAISEGLPVICLDLGGPGVIVNDSCGIVVPTADADEAQIVTDVANSMVSLGAMSSSKYENLSMGAIARANVLTWSSLTECVAACDNRIIV
jgi:glycosyltransferase involved in cell wall biosynthesis